MNQLTTQDRAAIVRCLCEGNSSRSTSRITGRSINTVQKLLRDMGEACAIHHDKAVRNLDCQRIQLDEVWSFVGCKQKNKPDDEISARGDAWTWIAIDADTKLIPSYLVSDRETSAAMQFIADLADRLNYRPQITSDGYKPYRIAIREMFGKEVDYAMLMKMYSNEMEGTFNARRYSPPHCCGTKIWPVIGQPDYRHISTSYV